MTRHEHKSSCIAGQTAVIVLVILLVCAIPVTAVWATENAASCLSATGEEAEAPCRRELLRDPNNVEIRFALSDAYMGMRRYADAVSVLREGLERFPGDEEIKKKLILAESYLKEQQFIEKQQQTTAASSQSKKQETQIRLSLIRCKTLKGEAAMAACNEGLGISPDHPELLMGRGNVWLKSDRIGNAMLDFEAALAADPKNREAAKNLRLAQTKRAVKVTQCLQVDGLEGLDACDAALLKGTSDEFAVQKRRAGLLQSMGREKEALAAYRVAAGLNPADGQIAQYLAALTPRSATPTIPKVQEPAPTANQATGSPTVKRLPPAEKKSIVKPVAPAAAPNKVVVARSEPRTEASPDQPFEPLEVKKPVQEMTQPSTPLIMAVNQPRQYSNAPEVPGITH